MNAAYWCRGRRPHAATAWGWAVLFALLAGCGTPAPPPLASDGVLDLRRAPPGQVFTLAGTWGARAGVDSTHFAAFDYDDAHWRPVPVPALFIDQGFSDEGVVWYRLHLRQAPGGPRLRAFVQYAGNASELYVGVPGVPPVLAGHNGRPALDPARTVQSRADFTITLPSDTAFVLAWRVSNHDYRLGGPFYAPRVAPEAVLDRHLFVRRASVLVVVGLYLTLFLSFVLYWLWNPRDPANLAVALVALVMAARVTSVEGYFEYLFPALSFDARILLEAIPFFLIPGTLLFSMWALFPQEFAVFLPGRGPATPREPAPPSQPPEGRAVRAGRWFNTVLMLGSIACGLGFGLVACFLPARHVSDLVGLYLYLAMGIMGGGLVLLGQIVMRQPWMGGGVAASYAVLIAAAVHDVLVGMGYFAGAPYVTAYAFVVFMLIQSYVVARRNARNAEFVRNYAGILEDEVQRRTVALYEATQAAQAASTAKSRFLSSVSHEIRTPISSIISFAQLLEDELEDRIRPQERDFLRVVVTAGRRLLDLVGELLDLAKAESGQFDLQLGPVAAGPAVDEVMRQLHPLAAGKGLALEADRCADDLLVLADEARLRQVLTNLVSNAIKFTDAGGVTVTCAAGTLAGPDGPGPAVAFRIRDTGMGISPEFMPRLFDPFSREARSRGNAPGSGLGLSIARDLVQRMRGTITVESEPGRGTCFIVTLPRPPAGETLHPAP